MVSVASWRAISGWGEDPKADNMTMMVDGAKDSGSV